MDAAHQTDDEQTKLWNGLAGRAWVEAQDVLDQMFKPLEELLAAAVSAESGGRVLDVGCGTGSTTLAIARLLGVNGHRVGIDISEPMIAAARIRAEREGTPARFICGDAQIHAFEPASFDTIIVALRRDVLRRLRPRLREPAARRHGRRRPSVRRMAECFGEPVHDDGRARGSIGPAGHPRPPAGRAGAIRLRGSEPCLPHPGGERLDRDRHPAARCTLHAAGERS